MDDIKTLSDVKNSDISEEIDEEEPESSPEYMLVSWKKALSYIPKSDREKMISGYDIKSLAKVFEDPDVMRTSAAFLKNGMNVCATAKKLYMHRNTLTYKLNSVKKLTGLDPRDFNDAVTFVTLYTLYLLK